MFFQSFPPNYRKPVAALLLAFGVSRALVLAHPHTATTRDGHTHPDAPIPLAAATAIAAQASGGPGETITSGSGEFRYQYDPSRLQLPPEVRMKHGHGLCHDQDGNIYFNFEPEKVDDQTRSLVRFNPDGSGATLLGANNELAQGVPHGLAIHVDKDGKQVLYHANNRATVQKTTLDGTILWSRTWGPEMGNYKPTDTTAVPGGDRVFVGDGYGSSMIHVLKAVDGIYAGKSWGGLGASHGELNCPHGITYDPRKKLLLISDRGNKRLEYYTIGGQYHSTIEAKEIQAPCNADIRGDHVLVPNLDGPLVILDKDNQVVSVIEVGKLLGARGFKHPHDAIWLPNGDIVVCTWNPGRIAYWKKIN